MKIENEKISRSLSRTGRELQRYSLDRRQVVGCIPYRFGCSSSGVGELEVMLISSQKCEKMMFPKGGWESDESKEQAVQREALEEAGITGSIQCQLGIWTYKSKSQDKMHDGHMFSLLVEEQLEDWPEKDVRKRKWVKPEEAKLICTYAWMNEALDVLIETLKKQRTENEPPSSPLSSSMFSLEAQLNDSESKWSIHPVKVTSTQPKGARRYDIKVWPNYAEKTSLRRNSSLGAENFKSLVECPH